MSLQVSVPGERLASGSAVIRDHLRHHFSPVSRWQYGADLVER